MLQSDHRAQTCCMEECIAAQAATRGAVPHMDRKRSVEAVMHATPADPSGHAMAGEHRWWWWVEGIHSRRKAKAGKNMTPAISLAPASFWGIASGSFGKKEEEDSGEAQSGSSGRGTFGASNDSVVEDDAASASRVRGSCQLVS